MIDQFFYCPRCPAIGPLWHMEMRPLAPRWPGAEMRVCDTCGAIISWFSTSFIPLEWQHRDVPAEGTQRFMTNDLRALVLLCLTVKKSLHSIRQLNLAAATPTMYFIDVRAKRHLTAIDALDGTLLPSG